VAGLLRRSIVFLHCTRRRVHCKLLALVRNREHDDNVRLSFEIQLLRYSLIDCGSDRSLNPPPYDDSLEG